MSTVGAFDAGERARSLANLKLERDAIALYDRLAGMEKDPRRAAAFRAIAANERRHAEIWASRLREAGVDVPAAGEPRPRVRLIIGLARAFGTRAVSDLVKSLEGEEEDLYEAQTDPAVASIVADEREHAEIWERLDAGLPGLATTGQATVGAAGTAATKAAVGSSPRDEEAWHRAGRTGTLRAAIFGVSDGLVSNLSLVMGVAGANADNRIIVLAGIAGLLAGAFSMAAGEYISMQSQRELFERQISLEREEMKIMPEAEERELAAIFRAKGLSGSEASMVAGRLMQDPTAALDTKVREELGLDPQELGSPWGAALYSFLAFGVGAFLPLLPFLVGRGTPALVGSVALALAALFVVGAGVSLLTGRSTLFSGARQVFIGAAAAIVTFSVGTFIGVQVS
jgi:VIT1/CCC1 family predicted Fe2+/Mn2+ transporter